MKEVMKRIDSFYLKQVWIKGTENSQNFFRIERSQHDNLRDDWRTTSNRVNCEFD